MRRRHLALAALAVLVSTTAACGGAGSSDGEAPQGGASSSSGSSGGSDRTLTVFAAASLRKTFTTLGERFEDAHPHTTVTFNFAGSSDLVAQLQQGASADVLASADVKNMGRATGDGLVAGQPVDFATNALQIAVPPDNPAGVRSLADLARRGVKVVVCAPQVPCGTAATTVEAAASVDITPVSEEQSVTDVLGKVVSGEADAGLVYVTDVRGAGDTVRGIAFPEASAAVNTYPIAVLEGSPNRALAKQFVELVTGAEGRAVLAAAGFGAP